MNIEKFNALVDSTFDEAKRLLKVKGGGYTGGDDRLANFRRGAQLTGTTPLQVAFVYASKHYDAIATAVRDQATGNTRERSEAIGGRCDDLINYCLFLKALFAECENADREIDKAKLLGYENPGYVIVVEPKNTPNYVFDFSPDCKVIKSKVDAVLIADRVRKLHNRSKDTEIKVGLLTQALVSGHAVIGTVAVSADGEIMQFSEGEVTEGPRRSRYFVLEV